MIKSLKEHKFFLLIFFFSLLFVMYLGNPSNYYFLNDDFVHIPQAAELNFLNDSSFIRPVSNFSLWVDYIIWGKDAYGYHLTNLIIHFVNVILVFFTSKVLFRYFDDDNKFLLKSILSCTLFLVYAFHSESIFWILGRGSSLNTLFFLCSLLCFLKSQKSYLYFTLSLIFFSVGLFTYELIWVLPIIVTLLYIFQKIRTRLEFVIAIWISFILFLLFKFFLLNQGVETYELGAIKNLNLKALFYNYNTLLARSFLPPFDSSTLFLLFYLALISVLILVIFKWRNNHLILFSFFGIIISLLPAITLGIDTHDTESERFIYLATFFVIIFIVEVFSKMQIKFLFVGMILLIFIHCILLQNAATSYRFSSEVSRKSLECIGEGNQKITAINLPMQYKGALIFRKGFGEAVEWILNGNKDSVTIYSQKDIFSKKVLFSCVEIELAANNNSIIQSLSSNRIALYKQKDINTILEWKW